MHHSGERIVTGLPTIDVVVRVDKVLVAAGAAQELSGTISDDLERQSREWKAGVSNEQKIGGIGF